MKHYNVKLYMTTNQNQKFLIRSFGINATDIEQAQKKVSKLDLPFHHIQTITVK